MKYLIYSPLPLYAPAYPKFHTLEKAATYSPGDHIAGAQSNFTTRYRALIAQTHVPVSKHIKENQTLVI